MTATLMTIDWAAWGGELDLDAIRASWAGRTWVQIAWVVGTLGPTLGLVGALAYWRRDRRRRRTELAAAETRAFLADPLVELVRALLEHGSVRVDATGRPVLDGEPGWTLDRSGLDAALARAPDGFGTGGAAGAGRALGARGAPSAPDTFGGTAGLRGPDLLLRRATSAVAAGHARLAHLRARGLVREADVLGLLPESLRRTPAPACPQATGRDARPGG